MGLDAGLLLTVQRSHAQHTQAARPARTDAVALIDLLGEHDAWHEARRRVGLEIATRFLKR